MLLYIFGSFILGLKTLKIYDVKKNNPKLTKLRIKI